MACLFCFRYSAKAGLKVDQMLDLEQALSKTLSDWLDRNTLRPTQYTVQAISEYPVPTPSEVKQNSNGEVFDLGPEDAI